MMLRQHFVGSWLIGLGNDTIAIQIGKIDPCVTKVVTQRILVNVPLSSLRRS